MRKVLMLLVIAGFVYAASAQTGWKLLGSNQNGALYITSTGLVRSGATVKVWVALETPVVNVNGTKRQETYREYDCAKQTSKTLQMKTYDAKGGHTDTINYRVNWHSPVAVATPEFQIMNYVCRSG